MLSSDFVVYSTHGNQQAKCVSLLIKRTLRARVDLFYVDAGGLLIVDDIAVKKSSLLFMRPTTIQSVVPFSVSWGRPSLIRHA